jgi:hypothetical protein
MRKNNFMRPSYFFTAVCLMIALQSCEFNCSVGNKDEGGKAKLKDGARIYNNIQVKTSGIKLDKAYLLTGDDKWLPEDNSFDFKGPVKLQFKFASGWQEENGKVFLGASEKIVSEKGEVVLEKADLFETYTDGIPAEDSRSIYITALLKLKEGSPPTSFTVFFRIWDKKGDAFVEGSYQLLYK